MEELKKQYEELKNKPQRIFGQKRLQGTYGSGVYEGEILNGKADGKGKLKYDKGQYCFFYEGEFKQDLRNGEGKLTFSNGDIYEGGWENDV